MKTPLQEVIETIKEYRDMDTCDTETCNTILMHIASMIEKERRVILHAFLDGYLHSPDEGFIDYARNYYDETFNTKEK